MISFILKNSNIFVLKIQWKPNASRHSSMIFRQLYGTMICMDGIVKGKSTFSKVTQVVALPSKSMTIVWKVPYTVVLLLHMQLILLSDGLAIKKCCDRLVTSTLHSHPDDRLSEGGGYYVVVSYASLLTLCTRWYGGLHSSSLTCVYIKLICV